MGKNYYLKWTASFVFIISMLTSCHEKEFDKYYEQPSWLKGDAWQVLQSDSNYSIFLEGVEMVGFKDLVNGKGIITVMAPDNAAFQRYFTANGYTSLADIKPEKLKEVITFHLLYYSFNKERIANYQPEGVSVAETYGDVQGGIFYKFRTRSNAPISTEIDYSVGENVTRKLFHKDRYLPIYSSYLFKNNGNIDAASNYEFFYPNSDWTAGATGVNVSNASVTEYAIATDNGYIYKVSEVLDLLETIETQLALESDFSLFKSAVDRFAVYTYDAATTEYYGADATDSLWLKYHGGRLPNIASEWSYNGAADGGTIEDYAYITRLTAIAYNVFAPDNTSLQNFFDDFWAENPSYSSLDDVPFVAVEELLANHASNSDLTFSEVTSAYKYAGSVFPSNISAGTVLSAGGNAVNFDPSTDVLYSKMCVNGAIYGLNKVMKPALFESITGPLYKYERFKMALYMLYSVTNAGGTLAEELKNENLEASFYIPTDEVLTEHTFINSYDLRFYDSNPKSFGSQSVQLANDDGYSTLSSTTANNILRNHVAVKDMTPGRSLAQGKVYKTLNSYQYLLFTDDGIYSSSNYNLNAQSVNLPLYDEITSFDAYNGTVYELSSSGRDAGALLPETGRLTAFLNLSSVPAEYNLFATLVTEAGMLATVPAFDFLYGEKYVIFAPSNDALQAGLDAGDVPPRPIQLTSESTQAEKDQNAAEKLALATYLKRYFVHLGVSFPIDLPFPGAGIQGSLRTFAATTTPTTYASFTMTDTGTDLTITDQQSASVNVVAVFPNIFIDGFMYPIDGLLKLTGE